MSADEDAVEAGHDGVFDRWQRKRQGTGFESGGRTAIIWATGRPTDSNPAALNLYAFAAAPSSGTLPLLYSSQAGTWPNVYGNANIVPVLRNGRVFVASNKQLTIFGLGGGPFVARRRGKAGCAQCPCASARNHRGYAEGVVLMLGTRAGKSAQFDDSDALRSG